MDAGATLGVSSPASEWSSTRFLVAVKAIEPQLARYAVTLCKGDRDLADDVLQEALVSAYKACKSGRGPRTELFRAWMYRIVTNHFRLIARKQRSTVAVLSVSEERLENVASPTLQPSFEEACLEMALKALPETHRACIELVDLEELTYDEAATVLSIPVGTVRSRVSRSRLRMFDTIVHLLKNGGCE